MVRERGRGSERKERNTEREKKRGCRKQRQVEGEI